MMLPDIWSNIRPFLKETLVKLIENKCKLDFFLHLFDKQISFGGYIMN